MTPTRDKYDEAIDWLVEHADDTQCEEGRIIAAWGAPGEEPGGCLFEYATPTNADGFRHLPHGDCGCLTLIRRLHGPQYVAWTPQLTAEIRADDRLPRDIDDIADLRGDELRAALQPFAEWQRRLDREIRVAN